MKGGDEGADPPEDDDSGASQTAEALVATGLPVALQVARRIARRGAELDLQELESIARCSLADVLPEYDPERGQWKSFVAARVGFALCKALRKERRRKGAEVDAALALGVEHVAGLEPCGDALAGDDQDAYERLAEVTGEVAAALALHLLAEKEEARQLVREAVSDLDDLERQVVQEHFFNRKSFRTMAREMGHKLGKVRRAYERAVPILRRRLQGVS